MSDDPQEGGAAAAPDPPKYTVAHGFAWARWTYRAGEAFTAAEFEERGLSDAAAELFVQRGVLEHGRRPTPYGHTPVSPYPAAEGDGAPDAPSPGFVETAGGGFDERGSARPQSQPRAAKRPLRKHDE